MNRKTNIFYLNNDNDNKFLTFDNYTDALTGDILATNQKLWPSRFLCVNIEKFNNPGQDESFQELKSEFINKYLIQYYENKLAFLRDKIDNNEELKLVPLTYLILIICFYGAQKSNKGFTNISEMELDLYSKYKTFSENKEQQLLDYIKKQYGIDFCYIGDIVEQDYNGTYADIICTISPNKRNIPLFTINNDIIVDNEDTNEVTIRYNSKSYDSDTLYGWDTETDSAFINNYLSDIDLLFDDNTENKYHINSIIKDIEPKDSAKSIKFNVIIPLFDSRYINENNNEDETISTISITNNSSVPLGIYFSDKEISLENNNNGYSSNWSLLISTQFKPFPYSQNIVHNFDDTDSIKDAYITFAEILAKQTNFIDLLNKYNDTIISLTNRVALLERSIGTMSNTQNIDEINQKFINLKNDVQTSLTEFNTHINSLQEEINVNKLKWQIKNNE